MARKDYWLADYSGVLQNAIDDIDTTEAYLVIDDDANVAASTTIPENIVLDFRNGAKLVKTSSGAIEFMGLGVLNADTRLPYFSGFAAGQVTWDTDAECPREISTEIVDTANDSLSDRLIFLEAAVEGKPVTFICYPRTVDDTVIITEGHHIYLTPGEYNNVKVSGYAAFRMDSNTSFTGAPGAVLYESDTAGTGNMLMINAKMMNESQADGSCENITIDGVYFKGNGATGDGMASTVIIGNCINGRVQNCTFDDTHAYGITIGGYGLSGNYAENCFVENNRFIRTGTQLLNVINGKNICIRNNIIDLREHNSASTFSVIDVEPNDVYGRVEDILIDGNLIDARTAIENVYIYGIVVQAIDAPSCKNPVVTNNTIIGFDPASENFSGGQLAGGIGMSGCYNGEIRGNHIQATVQDAISGVSCRSLQVSDNDVLQVRSSTAHAMTFYAFAECDIFDNRVNRSLMPLGQHTGIQEKEYTQTVTTSGSTVTNTSAVDAYLRFNDFWVGLTVTINNTNYVVSDINDASPNARTLTTSTSVGTLTNKTFTHTFVNVFTDSITVTSHGHQTGSRVVIVGSGTLPNNLTSGGTYYLIRVDNDTIQLATTLADALGNIPINFTTTGSGTNTIYPVLLTKFSSNTYRDNKVDDGITLEPGGTSIIYSDYLRTVKDFVAPAQITSNQNNYDPGRSAYRLDLSTDASRNLTGLVFTMAQINGEKHLLYNAGSNDIVLKNQDSNSTAANRFKNSTGSDLTLTAGQAADLEYVGGSVNRWVVFKRG